MRVLLPPSETKKSGGGNSRFKAHDLSFYAQLAETRKAVRSALETLSKNEDEAIKALKLGKKSASEIANNLTLHEQPTLPAIDRYTGVLFDAISLNEMDIANRKWLNTNVYIQSALFGLINASDEIPSYRLSASSRLPSLDESLKKTWIKAHSELSLSKHLILDFRSKEYANLAPFSNAYTLEVYSRQRDGSKKALNHFNKTAKGDLIKRMAQSNVQFADITEFLVWSNSQKLDIVCEDKTLQFVTSLGSPNDPRSVA